MQNNLVISFKDLVESPILAEFADAFRELTGISIAIIDPSGTTGKRMFPIEKESPICHLLHSTPAGLKACQKTDHREISKAIKQRRPICYPCHAGLLDIAVPIIIDGRHIATINCGQMLPHKPSQKRASKLIAYFRRFGLKPAAIRKAYFNSPFLAPDKFMAAVRLLVLFANYCCEMTQKQKNSSSDGNWRIQRAKQYGIAHYNDQLSLKDAALQAGYSPAHFSTVFKRQTGCAWCSFMQTIRVHKAVRMLEQSNQNITEIAYACGFGSLAHFNRVFRSLIYCSPTQYRVKFRRQPGTSGKSNLSV